MQALVLEKARKEREFYNGLFHAENSLNKQLKTSEDGERVGASLFVVELVCSDCDGGGAVGPSRDLHGAWYHV